ncbi:hypothetical protein LTR53_010112 [Teratosphaeriaceae sp. CCFEE 6253]|nr:hypothetical protein LTR53_010112 [Teratosphaeriaceae sp. CCFEE 6253]
MLRHTWALVAATAFGGGVLAQSSSSPTTTSEGEINIHTVNVAQSPYGFDPQTIYAIPGDVIIFRFWTGNHSVIRAEYGYPCIPYEDVVGSPGFYSGFEPVTNDILTWNLTINDTSPVFYYCGAPGSCIGHGMLGVINPDASVSLSTQITLSSQADYMLEPGQPLPEAARESASDLAASATTATVTVTASNPATTLMTTTSSAPIAASQTPSAAATTSSPSSSLSHGAIAGIAIGVILVATLLAALFFFLGRTKTMKDELNRLRGRPLQGADSSATPSTARQSWSGEKHASTIMSRSQDSPIPDARAEDVGAPRHSGVKGYYVDPGATEGSTLSQGDDYGQSRLFTPEASALGASLFFSSPHELSSVQEPPEPHIGMGRAY